MPKRIIIMINNDLHIVWCVSRQNILRVPVTIMLLMFWLLMCMQMKVKYTSSSHDFFFTIKLCTIIFLFICYIDLKMKDLSDSFLYFIKGLSYKIVTIYVICCSVSMSNKLLYINEMQMFLKRNQSFSTGFSH